MCSVCPARLCVHFGAWSLPECLKGNGKPGQTCTADRWAGVNGRIKNVMSVKFKGKCLKLKAKYVYLRLSESIWKNKTIWHPLKQINS